MSDISEQVGQLIREARIKKGLSQLELAQILGVTKAAVSGYETGRQNLTLGTLQKIATALDTPLSIKLG
ncbi:helix-turn-helix domain-containing protein [Spirosoma sp. HMF4905]|uniref:Helix-turn-helix domain-containing protein n=1 Tax=Spirosoma arboris TaxID=2682092 RepID=A0A7K1SKD0_9BACT|nr:helix-turn-helix transcriptional regulator [Spirosoma arboris]MVM34214.1 helix-turn-helix domain-containing protein [Spirosoma arboris]